MLSQRGGGTHNWAERGLFFCSLPLDAIINGREQRDGEPIRSRLACQPKTNCLLALTAGFYLHNSNPKAKAICTLPTPTLRGRVYKAAHGRRDAKEARKRVEPSHNEWNPPSGWINRGHNHTLIRIEKNTHLVNVIVAIHRTVRHVSISPCSPLFREKKPDRGVFFLIIMQMLFNGYRCHLHLVYRLDSRRHNFWEARHWKEALSPPFLAEITWGYST